MQRYYKIFNHAINCMINFSALCLFNIYFPLHNFFYWQNFAHQLSRNCKPVDMRWNTHQGYEWNIKLSFCHSVITTAQWQNDRMTVWYSGIHFFGKIFIIILLYIYNNIIIRKNRVLWPLPKQNCHSVILSLSKNRSVFSCIRLTLSELGLT